MKFFKRKAFRQGSVAAVITVLGVVMIVLLNMVVGALSQRFSLTSDMTENHLFAISDKTVAFLRSLERDVEIIVTNTEEGFITASPQQYFVQANEVIKKYAQLSDKVTLSYTDVIKDPSLTMKHADIGLTSNQILITSGDNRMIVNYRDLFNIQSTQYGDQIASSKAEQTLTSAILNVTSDKKIQVSVVSGHNEADISALTNLLVSNNYEVAQHNLLTEDIDPKSAVVILAAPSRDLGEDELRRLDAFLENGQQYGKTLFYMASYNQPSPAQLPNLSAFLAEWGVEVQDSVVYETASTRLLTPYISPYAIAEYTEETYSAATLEKDLYNAIFSARPLASLWSQKGARSVQTLLQFSAQSGVWPLEPAEDWTPTQADLSGPIPALLLSTQRHYESTDAMSSYVLVCGSVEAFDATVLGSTSFANSEYFLGLIDTLAGREGQIRIQDKSISYTTIDLTYSQVYGITAAVLVVLPVSLLILGIVIWLRRRHA